MVIQILPPEVASQIAAGEVVERPASVVKELVENALDASATQITVRCLSAGKKLIEVSDDGDGMTVEDLPLAVQRHATSKIRCAQDLWRIRTLGFRGEALASIASVARLTIKTRARQAEVGYQLAVDGGAPATLQAIGIPHGTTVQVEDLFFNVPARLKFLKSELTERNRIESVVIDYALAFSHVRFQLWQENRLSFTSSGNGERREILANNLGVEDAQQLIEVDYEESDLRLLGLISPPGLTRSNRREIHLYVNHRPVQDSMLTSAVLQAYHTLIMVGRFPLVWLFIEIQPEKVDVNVHPAKAEVRFVDPNRVFSALQHAIRRSLIAGTRLMAIPTPAVWQPPFDEIQSPRAVVQPEAIPQSPSETPQAVGLPKFEPRVPLLRWIGQVANTYIIAEGPDGLYLIDQHAAHERVLFERFLRQSQTSIPSQKLLHPGLITLSSTQARLLEEQIPILNRLGFEIVPFGVNTYQVRALPTVFSGVDGEVAVRATIDEFEENEEPLQRETEKRLIARICKRVAVKAGQSLSPDEQKALLQELENCQSPRTCPHGRPTMIHLSVDLLERQFGRRGAI
ncbi:MAG: DNA mismatch repair endonuclease MutL [Anaerolineae bacterium]|nr:MAG: DNA mismatch repair endonuclease MutL [Anaerolineae bacterium]